MSDSEENFLSLFGNLSFDDNPATDQVVMDNATLSSIIEAAVTAALNAQQLRVNEQIEELRCSIGATAIAAIATPEIERYEDCKINRSVTCDDSLDVIKSIPDFSGDKLQYNNFREAATSAFKVFEHASGSVKYYQAVCMIRNKVRGDAAGKLTSFGTPRNFKAMIARLDHEYGDKRPIHMIEQEMSTLAQGNISVIDFYNEIQKKLTALTNKVIMEYADKNFATQLNEKYRSLRVFISGLRKGLSDTVFSSRPEDLPAALALAEEIESNRARYNFAVSFSKSVETTGAAPLKQNLFKREERFVSKVANPNYALPATTTPRVAPQPDQQPRPEPMDIDPSFRAQFSKRSAGWKPSNRVRQGINALAVEEDAYETEYTQEAENALLDMGEEERDFADHINFLEVNPCSRT